MHLNINDQLLHGLALQTYIPEVSKLTLHVDMAHFNETDIKNIYTDLMRIDGLHNDSRILCNESNTLLDVLNDFTAYVSANPVMFTLRISEPITSDSSSIVYYQPSSRMLLAGRIYMKLQNYK